MNRSLADFFLLLPLSRKFRHGFRLHVQRAFSPVEVGVFRVLYLGVPNTRVQEQAVDQFLFFVHGCKHVLEFLLRVGLRRLLNVVKFGQNLAGYEDVPSPQPSV